MTKTQEASVCGTRIVCRSEPNPGGEDDLAAATTDERYDEARKRVEAKMGFFSHLAVFAVINIVFLIIAGVDWLWVTLFWGIGLALHAWQVFFSDSGAMAAWKERQIEKELGRGAPKPEPAPAPAPEPTKTEVPGPSR
ncbi:MAG TPA: 2TM domain-containing protein, partial [Candidatus Limnocylindria bacterium]|nr:2TM domain-containing protein [Candidatus Limnocylindria bacterium]